MNQKGKKPKKVIMKVKVPTIQPKVLRNVTPEVKQIKVIEKQNNENQDEKKFALREEDLKKDNESIP